MASLKVALIGRANVGKSTLFNRLTSGPSAIVSAIAGTTRDRKENLCEWRGRSFTLVDTGGIDDTVHAHVEKRVLEQSREAAVQADVILFIVDARNGITSQDQAIARDLQKLKKPVIVVANKTERKRDRDSVADFYKLGFPIVTPISAISSAGTGDMLDEVIKHTGSTPSAQPPVIKVALIGKPNVGKSSLLNALVGHDRAIVHDEPYTTRDANDVIFTVDGRRIVIIDTAGIRRKNKINRSTLESQSVLQSLASIKRADIVLFVTEAQSPLSAQDRALVTAIRSSNASVILVANKWDLIENKEPASVNVFGEYYKKQLNFFSWAPILFVSAKEHDKMGQLKKLILQVYDDRFRMIENNALDKFLKSLIKKQPPTKGKGTRKPYIYEIKQEGVNPPQFTIKIDAKTSLHGTYIAHIEKQLREKFSFIGTPIKIWVTKHQTTNK